MVTLDCPTCGISLSIEEEYRGSIGKCTHCNGSVAVPKVPLAIEKVRIGPLAKFKIALIIMIAAALIWTMNIAFSFDVSKPIIQYAVPVQFQKDPISEALLEEIHYSAKLDYLKSSSGRYEYREIPDAWHADFAEYTPQASALPWESYAKSLKGKRVFWVGYVMASNRRLFWGHDVVIEIPGNKIMNLGLQVSGDVARSLSIGQDVAFEGTIKSVRNTLGLCFVSLEDARIYIE